VLVCSIEIAAWTVPGQVRPVTRRSNRSRNPPASGPPHGNVISRRKVTGKDPPLSVAHAKVHHSHFVPQTEVIQLVAIGSSVWQPGRAQFGLERLESRLCSEMG
jgi:hypothetical protein